MALLVLASGCLLQDDEEDEEPDLFAPCPQWVAGPSVVTLEETVDGESSLEVLPQSGNDTALLHDGRPLDLFLLEIEGDGHVEMRVHALDDGRRLEIKEITDEGAERSPFIVVEGPREVEVFLTAVEQGTEPAPGGLRIDLEGQGDFRLQGTPFYRVCGVA